MSRSDEEIYSVSGQREHETVLKVAKDGQVRLCWRKLDRKSKKLNFSFQVSDKSMNNVAGQETLDVLNQELSNIQERLDSISRNLYLQQDMDKQHADCKHILVIFIVILSDSVNCVHANMDVGAQDASRTRCMLRTSLLHHLFLHLWQGRSRQHNA